VIILDEFTKRIKQYSENKYGLDYYRFWGWKISVEKKDDHILDENHVEVTHGKLMPIMRYWQTYRPFDTNVISRRLRVNLEEMAESYGIIRKYDLLSLAKAPKDDLKNVWNKLGSVKEIDGNENGVSRYYTIAACKPLMFIWGQTLAFDDIIRKQVLDPGYDGFSKNRWTFQLWYKVMINFRDQILENPDFIEISKYICKQNFGTDEIVPYGQFIDLYYWIGAKNMEK
jgi:hypothetical protein